MKEYFCLEDRKREKILRKITSILRKRKEIIFAFCHGTFLLEGVSFRDIDIALYLKKSQRDLFEYQQKIAELLEKEIKYPVDVKVLNSAPFYFLNNVFRLGRLLFTRDSLFLSNLIEKTSREAMANYNFSLQSFKDLTAKR